MLCNRACTSVMTTWLPYVYVHGDLVPHVSVCITYHFVLGSILCTCAWGPAGGLGSYCRAYCLLYGSLIFVRIFYLRSVVLLCIGPY